MPESPGPSVGMEILRQRRSTLLHTFLCVALLFTLLPAAFADKVVPLDDVKNYVVVRNSASSSSAKVGVLARGESADLLGSVPNWYRVKLANGKAGFVSKRWTAVQTTTPPDENTAAHTYKLDVVDVGTGLAVLVRGTDFTLVFDAGSNDDIARGDSNRMLAYMRKVAPNLTRLDHLMLSHPHRDHVELMPDLLKAYEVREVWDSGRVNEMCGYRMFLSAVRDKPEVKYHNSLQDLGTQKFSFAKGTCYGEALPKEDIELNLSSRIDDKSIALGQGASMRILHANGEELRDINENSLVVMLTLGNTRVLLMGDGGAGSRQTPSHAPASDSVEGELLACCATDLSARVLVVGHHGSMTASRQAFLDAVGASTFIVSSGPTKYGSVTLPDAVIMAELKSRGQVFETDTNDAACKTAQTKIGPVNDGKAGGCSNVQVVMADGSPLQVSVWNGID